jgi:hypothetical protein
MGVCCTIKKWACQDRYYCAWSGDRTLTLPINGKGNHADQNYRSDPLASGRGDFRRISGDRAVHVAVSKLASAGSLPKPAACNLSAIAAEFHQKR